jgi:hypothetical protein
MPPGYGEGPANSGQDSIFGLQVFSGFDAFKGISDSNEESNFLTNPSKSNFGGLVGLNAALTLPFMSEFGIGWQVGGSFGNYDWDGTEQGSSSEQQTFITTGFYRKGCQDDPLSFGIVYDWMISQNWGVDGTSPTISQWRGQVEYAFCACDSLGVYGTLRDKTYTDTPTTGDVNRAINQIDLFWCHKFESGSQFRFWFGMPERDRLDPTYGGTLGEWIIGLEAQVPLSESVALYGSMQYMRPSASPASTSFVGAAAQEQAYDLSFGLVWYVGGSAKASSCCSDVASPYMPVANNRNFLVDQSAPGT